MNVSALAAEIAIRVPALAQDCAVNRAHTIQGLIEEELKKDSELKAELEIKQTQILQKMVERLLDERDYLRKQLDESKHTHG